MNAPTRRSVLKGSVVLAAPVIATAAPGSAAAAPGDRRLARLEDEAAVRRTQRAWLRRANAGQDDLLDGWAGASIRRITVDDTADERIDVADDGRTATGSYPCLVDLETPIPGDCTLAKMAQVQRTAVRRSRAEALLQVGYVKERGTWAVSSADLATRA